MKNKHGSGFKARTWFMAAVLAAFATGCGDGIFGGGGGASALVVVPGPGTCLAAVGFPLIPQVNSSVPASGAVGVTTSTTGVAPSKLITATFSIAMNPATVTAPATFTLADTAGPVAGTVTMNAANTIATLTTTAALSPGMLHTATITTAALSAGAPNTALACTYVWTFTTGGVSTGLAPIDMGLAAPFGISATAGIAVAGGISTVNGDVFLMNPSPTCGGTPAPNDGILVACPAFLPILTGTVISPNFDPAANLAAIEADLTATYLSLCAPGLPSASCTLTGGTVIGAPAAAALGAAPGPCVITNLPGANCFTPGVYQADSTIDVTGDLTLDALGDPDGVFIFQAGSAINMNVGGSRVLLTGGAKASNVWWQAGSSAVIDVDAEFQGNVLANISITLNKGSTACGRMMAGALTGGGGGTITLGNTTSGTILSVPGQPFVPGGTRSTTCQ